MAGKAPQDPQDLPKGRIRQATLKRFVLEYAPGVAELSQKIITAWPQSDPNGQRVVRCEASTLADRLDGILKSSENIDPEILWEAAADYIGLRPDGTRRQGFRPPQSWKAPQFFFGDPEKQDQNAANWYPFARRAYNRRLHLAEQAKAQPQAQPLLQGVQ